MSSFCTLSENNTFLHGKISCFCIFLAKNDVFNTNRTPRGVASAMSHAIHKIVSKNAANRVSLRGVRRITPKVKTVICEQAPNHGSYFAYARLCYRNSPFTSLMEREGIAVLHDADHGLAGIEDNLITIVVVVSGGTVIGGLLPIHMNPPAVRKEPAVSRGVVALECQVTLA